MGDFLRAPTALGAPPGLIALRDGKLSVQLAGVPLSQVLTEVGRLSNTRIIWLNGEEREERVSVEFTDLPLAEGLERILRRKNFVLFYAQTPTEAQLTQIWVSSDRGTGQPLPPEASAKTPSPPAGKEEATEQDEPATAQVGDVMQQVTQMATSDPNPFMRANAIGYLGAHAQEDAQARETLEQIARSETNVRIRKAAAAALQGVEQTVQ